MGSGGGGHCLVLFLVYSQMERPGNCWGGNKVVVALLIPLAFDERLFHLLMRARKVLERLTSLVHFEALIVPLVYSPSRKVQEKLRTSEHV